LAAIEDDDDLYRRIVGSHLRKDGSVNSALFKRPSDGGWDNELSFDWARLATPEATATRKDSEGRSRNGFGIAALQAVVPRAHDYTVRHDPNPPYEPENDAHSLVEGETGQMKAWALAEHMRVVIHPSR
jgi:hypothetical protein